MTGLRKITIVSFFVIQLLHIVNVSSLGICSCSTCGGPKYNFYNNMQSTPCSCKNCQKYQNSIYPYSMDVQCCPNCNGQNTDCTCSRCSYVGSCDGCGGYSYNAQLSPYDCSPSTSLPKYSAISYTANIPPVPCPQTYKNFGYQLQVPVIPRCEPNYGSLDGIIDKTVIKCPCPCKPLY